MSKRVFHPILFSIFPVITLISSNWGGDLILRDLFLPFIFSLIGGSAIWGISLVFIRNLKKSALITSVFIFVFFSYGHIYNLFFENNSDLHYFIILFLGFFTIVSIIILKSKTNLTNVTKIANTLSLSLIIIVFANIAILEIDSGSFFGYSSIGEETELEFSQFATKPDVYLLIFDGYGNNQVLSQSLNFDNSDITNYLTQQGFLILENSRSNYGYTLPSITSIMRMDYLPTGHWGWMYEEMHSNNVMKIFKENNYEIINFNSGEFFTSNFPIADKNLCNVNYDISPYLYLLGKTSMLMPFIDAEEKIQERERIICTFSKLPFVQDKLQPSFVFSHLILPHPPYLFDSEGNFPNETILNAPQNWSNTPGYLQQVLYANKMIKQTVNHLFSEYGELKPIIILTSDHGPAYSYSSNKVNFGSVTDFEERSKPFTAIFFPGMSNQLLERYDSISSVNLMRLVLKLYLDQNIDLLDDKLFSLQDESLPLVFIEVKDDDVSGLKTIDLSDPQFLETDLTFIDFRNVELKNLKIINENLTGSNFNEANLENSFFFNSILSKSRIISANIQNTDFSNSILEDSLIDKSKFHDSNFTNTNFSNIVIKETSFINSDFTNADFSNSWISYIIFKNINFDGTNFSNIVIMDSSFSKLDLTKIVSFANSEFHRVNFSGTNLSGLDFSNSKFIDCDFSEADLSNANLSNSIFQRTDIEKANLTETILDNISIIEK